MDTARSTVIVVDTNIVCYRWIPGSRSPDVDEALLKDPDWIAPSSWRSEFRNALAGGIRQNLIRLRVAREIIDAAESYFLTRELFLRAAF